MVVTIVTGASQNHSKTLDQFILYFIRFSEYKLVVYNLGIEDEVWNKFKSIYNSFPITWKQFQYDKYPSYLNININAGEYAWKPVILYDTCEEFGNIVIWMDSGDIIHENFGTLVDIVRAVNIYSATSSDDIKTRTHKLTVDFMKCDDMLHLPNRNGACVGVNYNVDWVKSFVRELKDCALIKDCIAPEGSNRDNHRQDQAVLSVLYYRYQRLFGFKIVDQYIGYSIHHDID